METGEPKKKTKNAKDMKSHCVGIDQLEIRESSLSLTMVVDKPH